MREVLNRRVCFNCHSTAIHHCTRCRCTTGLPEPKASLVAKILDWVCYIGSVAVAMLQHSPFPPHTEQER